MLAESPRAFGQTYAVASTHTDAQWLSRLEAVDTWLGLQDGEPVGSVGLNRHPGASPAEAALIAMWVSPQARGLGVGERLVGVVLQAARARGLRRVTLDVALENTRARALYERCGFTPTGRGGVLPHDPTIHEIELAAVVSA